MVDPSLNSSVKTAHRCSARLEVRSVPLAQPRYFIGEPSLADEFFRQIL
jgi:hypothetical protein